jgi:hypothetical protein
MELLCRILLHKLVTVDCLFIPKMLCNYFIVFLEQDYQFILGFFLNMIDIQLNQGMYYELKSG